jgi:hypothetical protein
MGTRVWVVITHARKSWFRDVAVLWSWLAQDAVCVARSRKEPNSFTRNDMPEKTHETHEAQFQEYVHSVLADMM